MRDVPCKIILKGDKFEAGYYLGAAKYQLAILEKQMDFQGLKQGTRKVWLNKWTHITATMCFGIGQIIVACTPMPVGLEEKEKKPIPIILCGTSPWSEIIYSTDRGESWETSGVTVSTNNEVRCLAYLGGGKIIGGVNWRSGVLQNRLIGSEDNGKTWLDAGILYTGAHYNVEAYRLLNLEDGKAWCGLQKDTLNTCMRSENYGASWSQSGLINPYCPTTTNEYVKGKCYLGDGIVLFSKLSTGLGGICATSDIYSIQRSTNYGVSWTAITNPVGSNYLVYCFEDLGNGVVVAGTSSPYVGGVYLPAHIIRSEDYGLTWADMGQQSQYDITVLRKVGGKILAGTYVVGQLLESSDLGLTWTSRSGVISGDRFGWEMIYAGDDVVLSTTIKGAVKRSTNGGQTWEHVGADSDPTFFFWRAALCLECFYEDADNTEIE